MQIRRPRTNDPREVEKWQDEVSRQITNSQSTSGNEILFWILNEGRNPKKKEQPSSVDVEDVQIKMAMISINSQDIRDVLSKVNDIEIRLEMLAVKEQTIRDNTRQLLDIETMNWIGG